MVMVRSQRSAVAAQVVLVLFNHAALTTRTADAFSQTVVRTQNAPIGLDSTGRYASALKHPLKMSTKETVDAPSSTAKTASDEYQIIEPSMLMSVPTEISMPELSLDDGMISEDEQALADAEYQRGLITVGFITLVFASMSPALHYALGPESGNAAPPVLLLNAAVSIVALSGLVFGGPLLEASTPLPRSLLQNRQKKATEEVSGSPSVDAETASSSATYFGLDVSTRAGLELGSWKFLGTTANLYGLSLTTADHGAFLIQLTTLIVPVVQGIMGVPIPRRIVTSIVLALAGVFLFTQDPSAACSAGNVADNSNAVVLGDALCVVAAGFYATYDLRLFKWGQLVAPRELITRKIATQAALSAVLLAAIGRDDTVSFLSNLDFSTAGPLIAVVLWAGVMVNAIAPFLQVGGQQAVGPTRAQTLYASQPLWAATLSYFFLGETVGAQGLVGGAAFLGALFLAATAEPPDPNCGEPICEVE
uniref:EamA domain-containing protein n=1 Tax=Odontella aurita TaxID=265563 RepID=A0A6U6LLQ7_9STRA|mmetsp:Transcript_867/g.2486  ORF Transcript_867/g.2486 Transcript_867/m.2486 type:complete len:478 (+) Transcript_867:360-1793(+)